MRAIFLIDFECFNDDMVKRVAHFRSHVPPSVPVIWTITGADSGRPGRKEGFYEGTDRLFIKPDIDSSFDSATDLRGNKLMPYLQSSGITSGYVGGATLYGCVLGGARSMRSIGIHPIIMPDLTDVHTLLDFDHEEAEEDWKSSRLPLLESQNVIQVLRRESGPQPFGP